MPSNTIRLHRVLRTTPEKLYRACTTSEAIPLEACYLSWQESLLQLAMLVEPEIPD